MHTPLCLHATGEPDAYVRSAIAKGLTSIGFSDHAPVRNGFDPYHRMKWEKFSVYVDQILHLKKAYPEIELFLGIEADIQPGFEADLTFLKENYPIEYIIGSVHFLDDDPVFMNDNPGWAPAQIESFIHQYFDRLISGLKTGLFDIVAHLDVIKWNYQDWAPLILHRCQEVIQVVQAQNMAIELNTSGLRRKPQETYPAVPVLKEMKKAGIPVITGSDAHHPDEVGSHFNEARILLKALDYRPADRLDCGLFYLIP